AGIDSTVGPKPGHAGFGVTLDDRPIDCTRAAMPRQQRRMEADGLEARCVQNALRHDDRHESHYREVGCECPELIELALPAKRGQLAQRQSQCERFGLELIGPAAGAVWRRVNLNDLFTARMKRLERLL